LTLTARTKQFSDFLEELIAIGELAALSSLIDALREGQARQRSSFSVPGNDVPRRTSPCHAATMRRVLSSPATNRRDHQAGRRNGHPGEYLIVGT